MRTPTLKVIFFTGVFLYKLGDLMDRPERSILLLKKDLRDRFAHTELLCGSLLNNNYRGVFAPPCRIASEKNKSAGKKLRRPPTLSFDYPQTRATKYVIEIYH